MLAVALRHEGRAYFLPVLSMLSLRARRAYSARGGDLRGIAPSATSWGHIRRSRDQRPSSSNGSSPRSAPSRRTLTSTSNTKGASRSYSGSTKPKVRTRQPFARRFRAIGPRGAIRDVGKALGLPEDVIKALSSGMWSWSEEFSDRTSRELYLNPEHRRRVLTLKLAQQLMGASRH